LDALCRYDNAKLPLFHGLAQIPVAGWYCKSIEGRRLLVVGFFKTNCK